MNSTYPLKTRTERIVSFSLGKSTGYWFSKSNKYMVIQPPVKAIIEMLEKGAEHVKIVDHCCQILNFDRETAVEMVQEIKQLIDCNFGGSNFELVEYSPNIYNKEKHYPRLTSENYCAAVEIHRQVIIYPYYRKFSFDYIKKKKQHLKGINMYVPSNNDLIIHNTLNAQINDKTLVNYSINLYDKKELKGIFERIVRPDWYINHLNSYRSFFTGT